MGRTAECAAHGCHSLWGKDGVEGWLCQVGQGAGSVGSLSPREPGACCWWVEQLVGGPGDSQSCRLQPWGDDILGSEGAAWGKGGPYRHPSMPRPGPCP